LQTLVYLIFVAVLAGLVAWSIRRRLSSHRATTEEREAKLARTLGIDALVKRRRSGHGVGDATTIESAPPTIPHALAAAVAAARASSTPMEDLFGDLADLPPVIDPAAPQPAPAGLAAAGPGTIAARGAPTRSSDLGTVTLALNSMLVTAIQPTQIPTLDGNAGIATDAVSLDHAGLLRLERVRFARVALAYQQSHGFRARRFAGKAPIDVLMSLGDSVTPAGALRASRRTGLARLDELHAFHTVTKALHIRRAFFVAQEGVDEPAAAYAAKHGIVTIDARKLAVWIETTDPRHLPRLLRAARGKPKD